MFRRKLLALEYPQPDNFNTEGTSLLNYFPPKGKNDMNMCRCGTCRILVYCKVETLRLFCLKTFLK